MTMGSMAANPHSRSSPPIQPNEHGYSEKLPSFSEFLDKTRADTPPHTPSRSQGSHDASPHTARPQFDDVAWKEGGHRRNDTLGDPLTEDHRRRSSAVDPSLAMRHPTAFASVYAQEQRPSFSYARPHPPASYDAQQQLYRHSPSHPGLTGGAYAPATGPTLAGPTHRQSYYQEHRPPPQPYDYRSSYSSGPHAGYETGYGEVRFQQHVGADPNNFNRKRRGNLPKEATNVLKHWFSEHRSQPYPTEDQKIELCNITGLSMNQVSNWFINARRRQPAKEAREREANGGQPAQPAQPAQAAQAAER